MIDPSFFCIVLDALGLLLEHPNPDDALVSSIAEVYTANRTKFNKNVKEYVDKVSEPNTHPKITDVPPTWFMIDSM
jgi:hypothetical protein